MENVGRYALGMDGQPYIIGPDILHGTLLTHARKRYRLFVTGAVYQKGHLTWSESREYPMQIQYYSTGFAVISDIEIDQLPKWKKSAVPMTLDEKESEE